MVQNGETAWLYRNEVREGVLMTEQHRGNYRAMLNGFWRAHGDTISSL